MKGSTLILLFFILTAGSAEAQKIQYGGMQQVGLIVGQHKSSPTFNLINGIRFSRFFTGIGADLQFNRGGYYYGGNPYNTSAVYFDGRYYINKKKNFFARGDGGVNFINQNIYVYKSSEYKRQPGYYWGLGLGFKARIGKEIFYTVDINYTLKQTKLTYNYQNWNGQKFTERFEYRQYAVSVNMGIEIF